jgi:alpha-D-ribose 1-methylphosphonate 5-triphosphate diphosphatase PhnM
MTPSRAKVIAIHVGHVIQAKATDVISTKTSNATAFKAVHAASIEATHVTSAEATTMSSATAAAAAGLCTRGKKAAGKHGACQNHHHSSSHDILHCDGRTIRPGIVRRRRASAR